MKKTKVKKVKKKFISQTSQELPSTAQVTVVSLESPKLKTDDQLCHKSSTEITQTHESSQSDSQNQVPYMRKSTSESAKRKFVQKRLEPIKEEENESPHAMSLFHKIDNFEFIKRQGSLSVCSWRKRKVNNELLESLLKVKNPKLQFLLAIIDSLKMVKEDPGYLQIIKDALTQNEMSNTDSEEAKVFTTEQLREHRRTQLAEALTDLDRHDEDRLITDVLLQACQNLARSNEILQSKQMRVVSTMYKQNLQLQEIQKMYLVEQMRLHFTFMFACPLVMSFQTPSKTELKQVPQLNYEKEFNIIRDKMAESNHAIRYFKRQCTVESLQEVLSYKPLGMHFSGHGIQNTPDLGDLFYSENQGKGDFLLLETSDGDSQLVSRDRLKEIISKADCRLEFVVVLTCHSQFVGEIFLQAGTKHVVCIDQAHTVQDDAAMTFTETFYRSVFHRNMEVCRAFDFAKQSVGIRHGEQQEKIFLLLVHDKTQENCLNGDYSRMPNCKAGIEIKKRYEKHTCSGLFGKIMQGVSVNLDESRGTLSKQIRAQPQLIGRHKEMYQIVQKLLSPNSGKIYTIWGQHGIGKTALVQSVMHYVMERKLIKGGFSYMQASGVTSCEVFIRNFNMQIVKDNTHLFGLMKDYFDKQTKDSMSLFHLILKQISQLQQMVVFVIDSCEGLISNDRQLFKNILKLVLAEIPKSCVVLTSTMRIKDASEELIAISGLEKCQAYKLFQRHSGRIVQIKEQNALLQIKPDPDKYPELKLSKVQKVHDHHLFKLIGGNPQSILLIAPMLQDPYQRLTLVDIYKMLTSEAMDDMLQSENINIKDSISASMRLTIEAAFNNIAKNDHEALELFFIVSMFPGGLYVRDLDYIWARLKNSSDQGQEEQSKEMTQQTWKRAWLKLKGAKMLVKLHTHQTEGKSVEASINEDIDEIGDCWDENDSLQMPIYLINYALSQVDQRFDLLIAKLENIVSKFLLKSRLCIYRNLMRSYGRTQSKKQEFSGHVTSERQQGIDQANMTAFFDRMIDKYLRFQYIRQATENLDKAEPSDLMNKELVRQQTLQAVEEVSSNFKITLTMMGPSDGDQMPEESQNASTINALKQIKALLSQVQDRQNQSKAKRLWVWAVRRIKDLRGAQMRPSTTRIKFKQSDVSTDEEEPQQPMPYNKARRASTQKDEGINLSLQPNQLLIEKQVTTDIENFLKNKQKKVIKRAATVLSRKKTQKLKHNVEKLKLSQLIDLQVGTRMSLGFNDSSATSKVMDLDEYVAIVHLTNLYIAEMPQIACSVIETQLTKLNLCSDLFHGNLARIHALCLQSAFITKLQKFKSHQVKLDELKDSLVAIEALIGKSSQFFSLANCPWGTGLTNYQQAHFISTILIEADARPEDEQALLISMFDQQKEMVICQCVKYFEEASHAFTSIKHLRGMALSARGMYENRSKRQKNSVFHRIDDEVSEESFESEVFTSSDSDYEETDKWWTLKTTHQPKEHIINKEVDLFELKKAYQYSMCQFYDEQSAAERDSCISRKQGEEFSLLTEIAKSASVKMLFETQKYKHSKAMGPRNWAFE